MFTPSVEGYHQGEVRDFLQRVAREVRNLHAAYSAQSGSAGALVPLPGADQGEPHAVSAGGEGARLTAVSDRLEALVTQLEGSLGATPGSPSSALSVDQPLGSAPAAPSAPTIPPPATNQAPATTTAATSPSIATTSTALAPTSETPRSAPAARQFTGDPTYIERVPVVVEDAPTPSSAAADTAPLPRVPTDKLTPSLGALSPSDPMFSDNANDLLDGVLDDVMGKLSDDS